MFRKALFLAILSAPAGGDAQQIVEIDYSSGRTIIDHEWRAMLPTNLGTDWSRGLLYVHDKEEPDGIMVFSLETGEWVRTIPTPRGDGPFEFSQGKSTLALAPDGTLHVAGFRRVVSYDPDGTPLSTWTPRAPTRRVVCDLGGKPAVPVPNGVLRHETEVLGPDAVLGHTINAVSRDQGMAIGLSMVRSRITCTEDRAFVVTSYDEGPDSVFAYPLAGGIQRIAVPTGFTEEWGCRIAGKPCPPWSHNVYPSTDGRGNLVLLSADWRIGGVIINPDTGCHAFIRKDPSFSDWGSIPVRVSADSLMVFHAATGDGNTRRIYPNDANRVSIHPMHRVSGEPCPGMIGT